MSIKSNEEISNLVKTYRNHTKDIESIPKTVPRPPPHPRLGTKSCHESNKIKNTCLIIRMLFIKQVIQIIQNGPKIVPRPPPHYQLGNKNCHEAKQNEKTLWV